MLALRLAALFHLLCHPAVAFKKVGRPGFYPQANAAPIGRDRLPIFEPYENGFTGVYGDATNPRQYSVNSGRAVIFDAGHRDANFVGWKPGKTHPVRFDTAGVFPRQQCPNMVVSDGHYFCTDKEFGYCDRRSGACHCQYGYTGVDCSTCAPTHFSGPSATSSTADGNSRCLPKVQCPNDCSGGGTCNYLAGTCVCFEHRVGDDCSRPFCAQFDRFCEECSPTECVRCKDGFFVKTTQENTVTRTSCQACFIFDPRCVACDPRGCRSCGDPLLLSIRRSGRRKHDPGEPVEEASRELAMKLPFGTQRPEAFDEAEPFGLSSRPFGVKLSDSTVACVQGLQRDQTWHCTRVPSSHVECGHAGTLSFSSPAYEVYEGSAAYAGADWSSDGGHGIDFAGANADDRSGGIWVTVNRTGGGLGEVSVRYALEHITTSSDDVSPTAFFTSSQKLRFPEGVVSLTFLVTVHDDPWLEEDETFRLWLHEPTGGATLGPQQMALVTVLDDELWRTNASLTTAHGRGSRYGVAGAVSTFLVRARTSAGRNQTAGGNLFNIELRDLDYGAHSGEDVDPIKRAGTGIEAGVRLGGGVYGVQGEFTDLGDGTYNCSLLPLVAGDFALVVQLAEPGGLRGEYWDNSWMRGSPVTTRVDTVVNFSWAFGALTFSASDFVSVRWSGAVVPPFTERYTFRALADDRCRLWVNDELLIDKWDTPSGHNSVGTTSLALNAGALHAIRFEYRELRGRAHARLFWKSKSTPVQVIPADRLFQLSHIMGSPFYGFLVEDARTEPRATIASGSGLVAAVAGATARFTIFPRDRFGNPRGLGPGVSSDLFAAFAVRSAISSWGQPDAVDSVNISGAVLYDAETAAFTVTYRATIAGSYILSALLLTPGHTPGVETRQLAEEEIDPPSHIHGSPFTVHVAPASTEPSACDAWGDGLSVGIVGENAVFSIRARDAFGNYRGAADFLAANIRVHIYHSNHPAFYEGTTRHLGYGLYGASYSIEKMGVVEVHVTVGGGRDHVRGSPFTAFHNFSAADGPSSVAYGDGVRRATSGVVANFTIQSYDRFLNARSIGGDAYHARLSESSSDVLGVCTSLGDGTHSCSYSPRHAGLAFLSVLLEMSDGTRAMQHIRGSPFQITVADGAPSGVESIARGPGLGIGGTVAGVAGIPSFFTVQAKDAAGNNRTAAGDRVVAVLTGPARIECAVQYLADSPGGVYELSYLPLVSGVYTLSVSVAGDEVRNGPFLPLIVPAQTAGGACEVVNDISLGVPNRTSFFTVLARDIFGNRVRRGGDDFIVQLVGADDPFKLNSVSNIRYVNAVVDQGDGTYVGSFNPPSSGVFRVHVALALGAATNAIPVVGTGLVSGNGGLLGDYSDYHWRDTPLPGVPMHNDLIAKVSLGEEPTKWAIGNMGRSVRWSGFVKPEHSGKYTFYATPNIISLRVGSTLLIDAQHQSRRSQGARGNCTRAGLAGPCEYAGTLHVRHGLLYDITAEWEHSDPMVIMDLKWGSLKGSGAANVKIGGTFGVAHASRTVQAAFDVSPTLMPGDPVRISCEQRDVRGCQTGFFETRVLALDDVLMTISLEKAFPGRTLASASLFRRARKSNIPRDRLFFGSSPILGSPFTVEMREDASFT